MIRPLCPAALAASALFFLAACQGPEAETGASPQTPLHSDRGGIGVTRQALNSPGNLINERRSLAVTEQAILSGFTLQAVMNQLTAQNGFSGATSTQLFRQLWDTQNPAPGQPDLPGNAHCTDNGGTLNGFAYPCRPGEGEQANPSSATTMASYQAIGLFNRFDLAPTDGADCGEYRAVFAKTGGAPGRNFIILEAVLPNPRPEMGLEGCRPVANFWRDLTPDNDVNSRRSKLLNFYFTGLPGFMPVFHLDNYGNNARSAGQVRTNQFMGGNWLLREFKLQRPCPSGGCALKFVPVTVKTNPFGGLFNPGSTHPLASEFQNTFFPSQVAKLAVNNVNTFDYVVPDKFNVGQSDAQGFGQVDDYRSQFGTGPSTLRNNLQAQLSALGSPLTPEDIVGRAQALSCAGCHALSNNAPLGGGITFPSSAGFVHNAEFLEPGPEGMRFQLSSALTSTFLPHRKQVLEDYLNKTRVVASNRANLVGVAAAQGRSFWVMNFDPNGGVVETDQMNDGQYGLAWGRLGLAGVATDNGSDVYWIENTNPGGVMKTGSSSSNLPITALASGRFGLTGIATDGVDVYWSESGGIFKVPKGGGATSLVLSRPGVLALAVDATHLHWVETSSAWGRVLVSMPKGGGAMSIPVGGPDMGGLAADGTHVYYVYSGSVMKMPMNGGNHITVATNRPNLTAVAVDATNVYWTEGTGNTAVVMTTGK